MLNIHFDPLMRADSVSTGFHCPLEQALLRKNIETLPINGPVLLPERMQLLRPRIYERHFAEVLRHFGLNDPVSRLRIKGAMLELLGFLYEEFHAYSSGRDQAERLEHYRHLPGLERAVAYIRSHLSEPLDLNAIAAHAGISRSYLALRFKQQYGVAPMRFLKELRIEQARLALRYENKSIKAIAQAVGFPGIQYFSRVFREETGTTPAVYRRQWMPERSTSK